MIAIFWKNQSGFVFSFYNKAHSYNDFWTEERTEENQEMEKN